MPQRRLVPTRPLDLFRTLRPLRHGPYDPTIHLSGTEVWRASRGPEGAATLHLRWDGSAVAAEAWGPGADWELGQLPDLLGEGDRPEALVPRHPIVAELVRRLPGLRLCRTRRVVEALLPAVLEQKVTGLEAQRVWRALVRRHGEPAPGQAPGSEPGDAAGPQLGSAAPGPGYVPRGLRLSPAPAVLAALPYFAYHPLGLERRRADVLRRIGGSAARLEAAAGMPPGDARARLLALPGIGPWTAAEALRVAQGDPDAVSVGDYHLPGLVGWLLAGDRQADDARMLELLEPYRGQRARVVALLELSGRIPPRRAPHMAPRAIERI
ncbi:MAG: DNA-3-methyladenine glycosylase family protein [Candidatus Limnocylindrales bacterium]